VKTALEIQSTGSWSGTGAVNRGLFVNVSGGSNNYAAIFSGGNVGIGSTAPINKLVVSDSGAGGFEVAPGASDVQTYFYNRSTSAYIQHTSLANSWRWSNGTTDRAVLDSSGRLLVGTSSSSASTRAVFQGNSFSSGQPCQVYFQRDSSSSGLTAGAGINYLLFADNAGGVYSQIAAEVDGNAGTNDYPGRLVFSTTADGASSPTERMRITNSGEIWVGASTVQRIGGITTALWGYDTAGSGVMVFVNRGTAGDGTFQGVSLAKAATSWGTYSDERGKTSLVPIENGLSKVGTLRAVTGRYVEDEEGTSRSFLIAQDIKKVLPEAVDVSNPEKLSLRYAETIPLLVAALKEAKERIEILEAEVAALKAS
jgi:hypothetical protein